MAEMKTYRCICCGIDVEATKFASAVKIKCESCKESEAPIDDSIIEEIQSAKKKSTSKKKSTDIVGDMKSSICISCGAETMITKFGSHKKALCENCKGVSVDRIANDPDANFPKIDLSRLDRSQLPDLENMAVIPQIIKNKALRELTCPACGDQHPMRIVKISDGSNRGLVIHYQCVNEKCHTYIVLSEQARHKIRTETEVDMFNYRGEQIIELLSSLTDTRLKSTTESLYNIVMDNNIDIHGIEVPKYVTVGSMKKDNMVVKGYNDEIKFIDKEGENDGNEES